MDRRYFLKSSSLLLGGLVLPIGKIGNSLFQEDKGTWFNFMGDAFIYQNKGGTILCNVNKDSIVLVDAQFPDTAPHVIENIRKLSPKKIDILFNTHHHNDHTAGNVFYKDYANKIVAHKNCVELQKKSHAGKETEKNQVYADTTFEETHTETIGKLKIHCQYFGPAHTGGDSAIFIENSGIVHIGDLVFNGVYPYIDQVGGGSIRGWVEVLNKLEKNYEDGVFFVFGHGSSKENLLGERPQIVQFRSYLEALLDYTEKGIKGGKKLDDLKKVESIKGFEKIKPMWDNALAMNIDAAYNELNPKKKK